MKLQNMKNIYLLLSASLLIASCGPTHVVVQSDSYQPAPAPAPVEDLSYQSFYDQLSPYGNWINYPGYGYVWMPDAGPDFRPYSTNGNWIYTDAGWTWASNYSWGWAPFHYGRWFYEAGYGWMWLPGNEWAPAWVSWRGSGDYYGWAPMGPRISIDVALNSYNPPPNYWNFVPRQYIGNPGWHNYNVDVNRNVTIINNTTIINNYSGTNRARYAYAPGPDPNEVRRVSGNNFTPVQLREANTPGERVSGSQYMIYQPRVNATPAARGDAAGRTSTPAPTHYESFNNLHPSTQYPNYNQSNNNTHPSNNNRQEMQNPSTGQPINNQPVYNNKPETTRPVTQTPSGNQEAYNQPVNNNRAASQNNANNQPVMQNPANNQPVNNRPSNNPKPNNQNPNSNQQAAQTNQPVKSNMNANRSYQSQSNIHQNPNNAAAQPSNVNHTQTTGRPSTNHNPNNTHPPQKTATPNNKPASKPAAPDQKPEDKTKTREAN
jgi:hypothetical protein